MSDEQTSTFAGWAILELKGHVRLGGYVTAEEIAGYQMLRIDLPGNGDAGPSTRFANPTSVYCLTPTTEEVARHVATDNPDPVSRWDLPQRYREAVDRCERLDREAARRDAIALNRPFEDEDAGSDDDDGPPF